MKISFTFLLLLAPFIHLFGQKDSTLVLDEVVVRGFETRKTNLKTPAAVSRIGFEEINRYNGANPLLILNNQTGVRMEERSPGSYRLAMRGSSIRSQFGVRNVKVYWNGIPMSDANGTTYFNLIDFNSLGSIEILKGPSSSIFGAGYGGVVSLNTIQPESGQKISSNFSVGSYKSVSNHNRYEFSNKKLHLLAATSLGYSDGYRDHSELLNYRVTLSTDFRLNQKHSLNYSNFYSGIDYNTPGGLTSEQLQTDRRASRPATAFTPGSYEQRAAIIQQYNLQGLTHNWFIDPTLSLSSSVFGSYSHLENPFISNYEDRHESNFGYRVLGQKNWGELSLQLGSEGIFTDGDFDVMDNHGGKKGDQQHFMNLKSSQITHFGQLQYNLPFGFYFTAGLSYNQQKYINHTRIQQQTLEVSEKPRAPWTPRLAFLKNFNENMSLYYSWSNGYSTPTAQEITSNFENASQIHLQAEVGESHEFGLKTRWNQYFKTDLAIFHQNVKNALIRNVAENGGEYFENTGNIIQKGLELGNEISFINPENEFTISIINVNLTLNDFVFGEYINEGNDFGGNILPGTSKIDFYINGRFVHRSGAFLNADLNYLSKMPLNSANEVYADGTYLSAMRIGWQKASESPIDLKIYVGIDNVFNKEYSVGYDFNAFGNRFYNPAPKRNFNSGINISIKI